MEIRQGIYGGQDKSVAEGIGGVDKVDANGCGMRSSLFLSLIKTQALWFCKKQMLVEEKTFAICQIEIGIEELARR